MLILGSLYRMVEDYLVPSPGQNNAQLFEQHQTLEISRAFILDVR